MPQVEREDILIKIKSNNYRDKLSLVVWHKNLETSYPNVERFLDDIHKHIINRLKEAKK